LAAAELEAQRQKTAREQQEKAARDAAEQQAVERKDTEGSAAPQRTERHDSIARAPTATQDSARAPVDQEEEKRQARLRAIGRQLDDEAARRDDASASDRPRATLPLSLSNARRARLWGRSHPNAELVRYAEAWEWKIQSNTPVDAVRQAAKQLRTNPMVTVAVRSDGSVESVSFVLSSGAAEVDEAIRRIVQRLEHYPAFPPELVRDYDVIEIRRTWYFDTAVRLY
jgi:TonB family protein